MTAKNCDKYRGKIILAPMVKIGTLPSRLLALRYGADLVYTEEIIDWRILNSKRVINDILGTIEYIDQSDGILVFSTCNEEKPFVIFQMGTSDPERALKVLQFVEQDVSGIDINMGCPKEFSLKGGMGAALLKKPEKIKAILTKLVENAKIPVTCKIRVLSTIEETLELALLIQSCGVSALAVHGRNVNERPQHQNRNHFIKAVAEKLDIPVLANGGSKEIQEFKDIENFRESCQSSSVMLARASEWNPSIFRKEGKVSLDVVIPEFLKLSYKTDNPFSNVKYTVQNMLRDQQDSPFGKRFLACQTMEELCNLWDVTEEYNTYKSDVKKVNEKKRSLEIGNSHDFKRLKYDKKVDPSIIVVPDCPFIRGHYKSNEELPKSILLSWARSKQFASLPKYSTEFSDKRFISVVHIGGKKFMTDVWEKNKKQAEQGAALACINHLGISPKALNTNSSKNV